jgi:hypothetical protein
MEKTLLKDLKERLTYLTALKSFVEKSDSEDVRRNEDLSFIKGMIYELERVIEIMSERV